jgi:hypothetical protein
MHRSQVSGQHVVTQNRAASHLQAHPSSLRQHGHRHCRPSCIAKANSSTAFSVSHLRQAAAGQRFGADSSEQQRQQLLQVVEALKECHTPTQVAAAAPTDGPLDGTVLGLQQCTSAVSLCLVACNHVLCPVTCRHLAISCGRVSAALPSSASVLFCHMSVTPAAIFRHLAAAVDE